MPSEPQPPLAAEFVALLVDPGSFEPWDTEIRPRDPPEFRYRNGSSYGDRLLETKRRLGDASGEAILTGRARLGGLEVALAISDFRFMGGSIGVVAGEKLVRAFDRALASSVPIISIIASGGVRLQEGCVAFVQMVKTATAATRLRQAGIPHVVYLGHPSTGGALAFWGSLGTFTFGGPGSLIGFAGPRVVQALGGESLPRGVQTAENLAQCGLIDDLLSPAELREGLIRIFSVLQNRVHPVSASAGQEEELRDTDEQGVFDPWQSVQASRDPRRPGSWDILLACGSDLTFLTAGRSAEGGDGFIAAVGRICGVSAVFLGHDRRQNESGVTVGPTGLRKAQRAIEVAGELRLPLVTVVDVRGAELSRAAEEHGLSQELAETLVQVATLESPTLSVLLGEGGGGPALSIFAADRVLAADNAWLAPIAPEGASAILWQAPEHAALLTRHQRITARELKSAGIVDRVVPERPDAAVERGFFLRRLRAVMETELHALLSRDHVDRLKDRERRYRHIGELG